MKILVIGGSGKIGSAIAHDLSQQKDVEVVGIAGNSIDAIENIAKWMDSDKTVLHTIDIMDAKGTNKIMCGYDVIVISLVERMKSYKAVEADGREIDCRLGKPIPVKFEMKKRFP